MQSKSAQISCFSLHQNIIHCLNMFMTIIEWVNVSLVSTCVGVVVNSSSAKPDSGVTLTAIVFIVAEDSNSCFRLVSSRIILLVTPCIKSFPVTVELHGGLRTNQRLPGVTTQWGVAVFPISDQWMQRTRAPFDYNKPGLFFNPHTEADLGEGCVPVGGKLGLL